MPGDHTITFRQVVKGFRFDKITLSPITLPTWVDLGMQSRHIPDSHLTAYPDQGSRPLPRFGRLNSAGKIMKTVLRKTTAKFLEIGLKPYGM
jgi:hypothetical protein